MNNYLWQTPIFVVSRVPGTIGTCPCSCFKSNWPSDQDMTSSESKILSIYPRYSVIGENVISGACGVHWSHEPINVISVDFKDSHFYFRDNQESYTFFSVIIGFFIQKNMGLETKILSLSILDVE